MSHRKGKQPSSLPEKGSRGDKGRSGTPSLTPTLNRGLEASLHNALVSLPSSRCPGFTTLPLECSAVTSSTTMVQCPRTLIGSSPDPFWIGPPCHVPGSHNGHSSFFYSRGHGQPELNFYFFCCHEISFYSELKAKEALASWWRSLYGAPPDWTTGACKPYLSTECCFCLLRSRTPPTSRNLRTMSPDGSTDELVVPQNKYTKPTPEMDWGRPMSTARPMRPDGKLGG